jgi:hypothetical protein
MGGGGRRDDPGSSYIHKSFLREMSPPLSSPRFQLGVREGDYKLVWGQPAALHRSYREAKEEGGLRLERPVLELYNLRQGGRLLLISNI